MDVIDEDEDVVLEGSAFHRMLQDAGCMGYQPIVVDRRRSFEKSPTTSKLSERLHNFIERTSVWTVFGNTRTSHLSETQIATILRAETLLVEHAEFVQSLSDKNSQSFWGKLRECSTLIASTAILGLSFLMERRRTCYVVMLLASSVAAFAINRKFNDFCAIGALKNLVSLQNELQRLYKKGLRIMSKQFGVKSNSKQMSSRFSNLEIDRLKYVQPLTETLLKSLSGLSRIYYDASLTTVKLLPKNEFDDIFVRFENEDFNADGEIMYDRFRSLYYVNAMVQSDTMQLLAVAYDKDTWTKGEKIPSTRLNSIVCGLCRSLRRHRTNLAEIIEKYESCKTRPVQRTFRGPTASRWKDLYLNLDLLSRKVAAAYEEIVRVLEDIDNRGDAQTSENDDFVVDLKPRVREIYKHIDSAKNFAEFSELLVIMLNRSVRQDEDALPEKLEIPTNLPNDLTIIRDTDPQIIDEVFEECITEEYLKSLYDNDDDDDGNAEITKLDKLLAKNFMSELKDALVEKCKSMTEREAKALLRKNREKNGDIVKNTEIEASSIPRSPPLPAFARAVVKREIVVDKEEKIGFRAPVPLPRIGAKTERMKDVAGNFNVSQQFGLSAPPPPPPPPRTEAEAVEENEKFGFDLRKIGQSGIPAFVNCEEEFVGSGENSEEEPIDDDSDCGNNGDGNAIR